MGSMKNWMLGAVVLGGAQHAWEAFRHRLPNLEFRLGVHERYVPPSPGPGYFWTAGYYDGGYWFLGGGPWRAIAIATGLWIADYYRDRGFDPDRRWDRDRDRDRDRFRR